MAPCAPSRPADPVPASAHNSTGKGHRYKFRLLAFRVAGAARSSVARTRVYVNSTRPVRRRQRAPYKNLRALEAVTEIPRSATGRILRRVLKERPTG